MVLQMLNNKLSINRLTIVFTYVLLLAIIFCGCGLPEYDTKQNKAATYKSFYTYEYDSCEYVGNSLINNNAIFTHKGNCKFCAERSKK